MSLTLKLQDLFLGLTPGPQKATARLPLFLFQAKRPDASFCLNNFLGNTFSPDFKVFWQTNRGSFSIYAVRKEFAAGLFVCPRIVSSYSSGTLYVAQTDRSSAAISLRATIPYHVAET
ncbi:MAG: hypothetical protein AB7U29_06835 [Desulfobulbus sp.]